MPPGRSATDSREYHGAPDQLAGCGSSEETTTSTKS